MKNLLYLFLLLSYICEAQAPSWLWAKRAGNVADDYSYAVCTDNSGHEYICGGFAISVVLGTDTLAGAGWWDVYVAKYDVNGNVIWGKGFGGNKEDFASSIAADASGNIYITGRFNSDSIKFGTTTLINPSTPSGPEIFIVKLDSLGNVLWAKRAGGIYGDQALGICTDNFGNVMVTGYFASTTITFDTITLTKVGNTNTFVVKYNTNGNAIWAKRIAGCTDEQGNGISADNKGNIYVTGLFDAPGVIFGGYYVDGNCITSGCYDYYCTKLDSMGNVKWAKGIGGSGNGSAGGNSVAPDSLGNVYVTGSFYGSNIVFDGITLNNNNSASFFGDDLFLAKYDSLGNVQWATRAGSNAYETGYSVSTDENGDVYVTGRANTLSMSFGTTTIPGNYYGGLIAKYGAMGNLLWTKPVYGEGYGIAIDEGKFLYLTGSFKVTTAIFDSYSLTNAGSSTTRDIFLAKIDSSGSAITTSISEKGFSSSEPIRFFPNPFKTELTIYSETAFNNATVIIYNSLGQKIHEAGRVSGNSYLLKRADMKGGIYFIRILQNGELIGNEKIIIEN